MTPEAVERRRAQAETLAQLTYTFSEAIGDRHELLRLIVTKVAELTGDGCFVRLLSDDGTVLGPAVSTHPDPVVDAMVLSFHRSFAREQFPSLFETLFDRRETFNRDLDAEAPDVPVDAARYLRKFAVRRLLATPLIARGRPIGNLGLTRVRDATDFSGDDERFLRDIAHRAALALDNSELVQRARRLADDNARLAARLQVLSEVSRAFSAATTDLDSLLDRVTSALCEHVGDFCALRRLTTNGQALGPSAFIHHPDPDVVRAARAFLLGTPIRLGEGIAGRVAASGEPVVLRTVDQDAFLASTPEHLRAFATTLDVRSLAILPLVVNGAVFGVVTLIRASGRPPYANGDIRLATDMCAHAALAIANSQLLAQVSASQRRFARLTESGLLGVLVADPEGTIVEANDAFLKIVGYTSGDLASGRVRWNDLTPPEWAPVNAQIREQLAAFGVSRPAEKEYVRRDGTRVAVLVGVARLDDGQSISFVADLSDRKRAESALRASEEQLRHAQKMEAVGRLAGGVAHDFNNVLTVILGLADLLIRDLAPGEPVRQDVEEIYKAGTRGAELTRQLLLFSRQQVAETRVVDVSGLLVGMKRMLLRLVGEDVDLTLQPGEATARVVADPTQVEQVVMNLVVNARDAMPTGGRLTIEVSEVELDDSYVAEHQGTRVGSHVMIAVSDTGVGMDRETQTRIFEPFFTTKPVGSGTGLGLSTVFGIVRQAGGSVWVYSEVNEGTVFKVYLPRVTQQADRPATTPVPEQLRGRETILLVEDEDQVRMVATQILQRFGYHVLQAKNAGEALLLCESRGHVIDLLLTDVVMPQVSGPELARRVADARPSIRILCMSGYTDDAIVRHGRISGGIAFLQKPLTPEKLVRKVREVLDGPAAPLTGTAARPE